LIFTRLNTAALGSDVGKNLVHDVVRLIRAGREHLPFLIPDLAPQLLN
jgi:hypothetical protein